MNIINKYHPTPPTTNPDHFEKIIKEEVESTFKSLGKAICNESKQPGHRAVGTNKDRYANKQPVKLKVRTCVVIGAGGGAAIKFI